MMGNAFRLPKYSRARASISGLVTERTSDSPGAGPVQPGGELLAAAENGDDPVLIGARRLPQRSQERLFRALQLVGRDPVFFQIVRDRQDGGDRLVDPPGGDDHLGGQSSIMEIYASLGRLAAWGA